MPTSQEVLKTYPPCSYPGCDRRTRILRTMLCYAHNSQVVRGAPLRPLRVFPRKPFVDDKGYVKQRCPEHPTAPPNGVVYVHRMVMSDHLRRPLTTNETVHHINGNRQDNRLENLRLFVSNHGPGASVEECIESAVNVLKRYAPDLLA